MFLSDTYIILGTDTSVGKTVVSAMLCYNLPAMYWKPIQAGLETDVPTDTEFVQAILAGQTHTACTIWPEAYRFPLPASPHLAAKSCGQCIDPANPNLDPCKIRASLKNKAPSSSASLSPSHLIIEGAGGLMVPLNEKKLLLIDLVSQWQVPVLLVARTAVGTINHTLLSIEALQNRDIPIHGLIFVGNDATENESMNYIAKASGIQILGHLPWLEKLTSMTLQHTFEKNFYREDF